MRKLTQKLVLSVVTMALVVVALGTSTFAWFTLQNSASIGTFTADVTAGEGIEVSLGTWDAVNDVATLESNSQWYTVIPGSVIENRLAAMYGAQLTLKDVTSEDGKVMQVRDSSGSLTGTGALDGRYIEFKLWFRSAEAKTIRLEQLVISGSSADWTVDAPFVGANNNAFTGARTFALAETVKVAAWTAARVSLIDSTDVDNPAFTYQRTAVTNNPYVASATSNSDVMPAVSYASGAQFGAASYYAVKTNAAITAPGAVIPDATKLTEAGNVTQNLVSLAQLGDPAAGPFLGSVTVRIWIEGWDADLFDAIFSTTLSVSMKFGVAA